MELGLESSVRNLASALGFTVVTSLTGACATTRSVEQTGDDVSLIADHLVESARQRVELSQIRVVVREIGRLPSPPIDRRATGVPTQRADPISDALEHDFMIALASRVNVVESGILGPTVQQIPAASTLSELASSYGATHLLVGSYQRNEEVLVVSVRLIDADTKIIVAAARGKVTFPEREETDPLAYARRLAYAPATEIPPPLDGDVRRDRARPASSTSPRALASDATVEASPAPVLAAADPPASSEAARGAPPASAGQPVASSLPPTSGVEDFETWRRRQQLPPTSVAPSGAAASAAPGTPLSFPWRTRALAERLDLPEDELFPWRKDKRLAELLAITPKK